MGDQKIPGYTLSNGVTPKLKDKDDVLAELKWRQELQRELMKNIDEHLEVVSYGAGRIDGLKWVLGLLGIVGIIICLMTLI